MNKDVPWTKTSSNISLDFRRTSLDFWRVAQMTFTSKARWSVRKSKKKLLTFLPSLGIDIHLIHPLAESSSPFDNRCFEFIELQAIPAFRLYSDFVRGRVRSGPLRWLGN